MHSVHRRLLIWTLAAAVTVMAGAALPPVVEAQTAYSADNQLSLNRASLEDLQRLPISSELAAAILNYRTYVAYFESVYELLEVEGMTPEILGVLKPMLFIEPIFQLEREELEESERRAQERYYVVQRLLSEEGASEGFVDNYVDQLRDPRNVNRLSFYDLISYQNVSPVDAVAILKEMEQSGRIENTRQLRSASGITYWGYRNLRDFVRFDDPDPGDSKVSGDYQFRIYNTPYLLDDEDNLNESIVSSDIRNFDLNTYAGRMNLDTSNPYLTNKLRLRWRRNWKAGILTHRNMGEGDWDETAKYFLRFEGQKPIDTFLGPLKLNSAVLGNYSVAFGQGLVMDATDFYSPRKTGIGFNVRRIGLSGDISRSDEYTLKGGALEASLGKVRGTLFYSRDDKDAILNPVDKSFNSYFTSIPRLSNELLEGIRDDIEDGTLGAGDPNAFLPMRDVMDEQVVGANFKYEFQPGTYLGVTGVEMRYHNNEFEGEAAERWDPDPANLVLDTDRLEDRDSEMRSRYNSVDLGNYRRIWGLEGQTVYKNLSLAAEYGKLETSDKSSPFSRIFSAGPDAFVANAYIQYDTFNFLALFRDYEIGYDNPYNRAFSEDQRYEQTLVDGNPFRLRNPYWATLGMGEPQPKAERGWYFYTRYQPTRQFTITGLEYDTWTRKADGADLKRFTFRGEYRPIFPLRFRIRHRISSRHLNRPEDVRAFDSWETRLEMRVNLSDYDRINILYSTSNVTFSARGRLNGPASGGDTQADSTATRGIPGHAMQAYLTHNFNDFLSMTVSAQIYDGFLWNFEDNEFVVVDGAGFRNWFLVRSRISEHLSWRFKWTRDHQKARTFVDIRDFGDLAVPTPDVTNARGDRSSYRFQVDYSF